MIANVALLETAKPAFEVMCRAARIHFGVREAERIKVLVHDVDWQAFLAALERHYVGPVVYRNLASIAGSEIPPKVLETIRVRSLITTWKGLQYATELIRLSKRIEAHSIQIIHYKGAVAAQQYYGSVTLRNFNDLDFLVRRSDLDALVKVLEDDGYSNSQQFSPDHLEHFVSESKEFLFRRDEFALEPHWSLTMKRYPFETDYEGFWQRAQMLSFKDEELRVLGAEDAVLVLCLAGAKSQWQRLQMVCDVAECVRTFPNIDWSAVQRMARATGCLRILHVGLLLAADLAGAELPSALDREVRTSVPVVRLGRDIVKTLMQSPESRRYLPDSPSVFSPLLFRQRERPRDRWRYLWRTITTPSVLHLERIPLPRVAFPLYRIIVPLHDYVGFPAWRLLTSLVPGADRAPR